MVQTVVRQLCPCRTTEQPMENHGDEEIHLQPMEEPHGRACGCLGGGCDFMGDSRREKFTLEQPVLEGLKLVEEASMLQQSWEDCCPWVGLMLEKLMANCLLWKGRHNAAGEQLLSLNNRRKNG
ncbi:hypothetical protein HGM15179_013802 [Zosterops borbonicus]|uniref:Uncharacterized protein n=1 Tax=Zosterops borbonicus TaxID=364589 RepID=A0A8K1G821_9PASS|nr:hypothetical protein HGM15179_013802 [Zosterops borbonicus]